MITITPEVLDRIHHESLLCYPDEGCGALLGSFPDDPDVQPRVVSDILPIVNAREAEEQYHRFRIEPRDYLAAEDEATRRGLDIVGFYHSHPDHPAVPSDYDRDHALPGLSYIVVATAGIDQATPYVPRSTSWELASDRSRMIQEADFPVNPAPSQHN